MNYGDKSIELESKDDEGQPITNNVKVAEVIVHELSTDNAAFEDSRYQFIYKTYCDSIETGVLPDLNTFINKENIEISKVVIDFISSPYTLAKWDKRQIIVQTEEMILKDSVYRSIFSYKAAQIEKLLAENGVKIESATTEEDQLFLIVEKQKLIEAKKEFNKLLGRIIIK